MINIDQSTTLEVKNSFRLNPRWAKSPDFEQQSTKILIKSY